MRRTSDEWIREYEKRDALWIHDGNPKRPHALLISGKHSNGFFNSRLVILDEALLAEAASDILELLTERGGDISRIEVVVGPQTGATKLAELLSEQITALTGNECFWASPAKSESEGKRSMVFSDQDLDLLPGRSTLLCEDVLTTGGSVELTADAVIYAGGTVLPFVGVLVNRSGLSEVSRKEVVALINRAMPTWMADECPHNHEVSEALRPKDPENWARLNATY
jgi:orotate phosphoribosyltransferase